MNHRRIILSVINENYSRINPRLSREILQYRLEFPCEVLPLYRIYLSGVTAHVPYITIHMALPSQIKFTGILLYTKYIGEYTEVEEKEGMRQKTTYFREYDGGFAVGCPTKVEPGLSLA